MEESGVTTVLDDAASGAASTATDIPSIDTTTHWYHDPTRALGPHIVEILTRTPFVLVLAYYVGKMFAKARLPRISGYLVTGVLCGSHVLGVLSVDATRGLAGLDNLCLALIGVAAGSELHLADLRRSPKPTLVMTASITVFSWVFVFVTFMFVGRGVEFIGPGASTATRCAVASLAATLGVARSPASAIAVLREMEGKGPFCSLVMSVTVVKDVLVVVMFAVNLELVAAAGLDFSQAETDGGAQSAQSLTATGALVAFMHPVFSVVTSVGLGVMAGIALGQLLKPPRTRTMSTRPNLARAVRCVNSLALSASSFWAAKSLGLEPLLLCVVAGALAVNRQHGTGEEERERLESVLRSAMPFVNVVFFTSAGCAVHLTSVYKSSVVACTIVGARLVALYHAARVGCDAIGAPESHKKVAWMGYVTQVSLFFTFGGTFEGIFVWAIRGLTTCFLSQAGVALGLVRTAARRFPQWGDEFGALMVATIVVNQLVGPPMFRAAIVAVGESGVDPRPGHKAAADAADSVADADAGAKITSAAAEV